MTLQHELVEEAIRLHRRLAAAEGAVIGGHRLNDYRNDAHTAVAVTALRCLRGDGDWVFLTEVLTQLVTEVAGARDAGEDERALEGLQ